MVHLNARFLAINAGLLTAVLSVACGGAPAGPSGVSDAVVTSVETSTVGTLPTTQAVSFRPVPDVCAVRGRFLLQVASVDKLAVRVSSNYAVTSKQCPHLTWTLSTKHDFAPSVDKLGKDMITIYSQQLRTSAPPATTVTAFGPNGLTASIELIVP